MSTNSRGEAARAALWATVMAMVTQLKDAIDRLMRGRGEGGNAARPAVRQDELDNLNAQVARDVRALVGSDAQAAAVLQWTRYGIMLVAGVAASDDMARAVQAQRTIGSIRLLEAGQVVQFAMAVAEAHGRGGDSEAALAALAFADIFSPADPQAGAAVLVLARAERLVGRALATVRALPARLTPAARALAAFGQQAATLAGRALAVWLAISTITGIVAMWLGIHVQVLSDWAWMMLVAVVGYILPTAIVPALLGEGLGLVLGAIRRVEGALHGVLDILGVERAPEHHDEESLAQRVSDFRGKLILPAALGVATWFAVWCLVIPSGSGSMVVALAAALLGAGASWVLKAHERDEWAKNALVATTALVAVGALAAVASASAHEIPIGDFRGGALTGAVGKLAHGVFGFGAATLTKAGAQGQAVAHQSAYGSALVLSAVLAIGFGLWQAVKKGNFWILAGSVVFLLWAAAQGDREIAKAPVPSLLQDEEAALAAAEAASQDREEAAAAAKAERELRWNAEAYAEALRNARQEGIMAEETRAAFLAPRR